MASMMMKCSSSAVAAKGAKRVSSMKPVLSSRTTSVVARAAFKTEQVAKVATIATAASMFVAENAQAASQIAEVAGGDNRLGTIGLLFVPALGWVGFNMLTPLQNQLRKMAEERGNSIATAVGLGAAASMLLAQNAEAATQVAELAGGDNRLGTIGLLFVPALGWVGFNMLTPLQNQLRKMAEERGNSLATAVGLGAAASMFFAQNAEAATQIADLAASDNRLGTIGLLFLPALGWVGFNMLTPLQNQLKKMAEERGDK